MNCLKRKRDTTPRWRIRNIFLVMIYYGIILSVPAVSLAKTACAVSGRWGLVPFEISLPCDTSIKDTSSYFEKYQQLINSGRVPFFGTWSDYFSSYLKIKRDSSFHFSWGFNGKSCWTTGKWERKKDTFYFITNPEYTELPGQSDCPLPNRLCYYKNKFYLLDSSGNLIKGKIPSAYMGKKSPLFKTLYFREKRFNLDYVDSNYYQLNAKKSFKFGMGVNVVLQPVPAFATAVSVGFIFSPRYIFAKKDKDYLSLGLPLTLGFTGIRDTVSIDPHAGIMVDAPLIFNFNHAWGSFIQGGSRIEYFIGGGAAYHYNVYSVSQNPLFGRQQVNGFGPVTNAGIRYSLGRYRIRNFELRFSYMKMIVESKTDVIGIGLILNF